MMTIHYGSDSRAACGSNGGLVSLSPGEVSCQTCRHMVAYRRDATIIDELDTKLLAKVATLTAQRDELFSALKDLLNVISADDLIPETVSYMRQARAAVSKAAGK